MYTLRSRAWGLTWCVAAAARRNFTPFTHDRCFLLLRCARERLCLSLSLPPPPLSLSRTQVFQGRFNKWLFHRGGRTESRLYLPMAICAYVILPLEMRDLSQVVVHSWRPLTCSMQFSNDKPRSLCFYDFYFFIHDVMLTLFKSILDHILKLILISYFVIISFDYFLIFISNSFQIRVYSNILNSENSHIYIYIYSIIYSFVGLCNLFTSLSSTNLVCLPLISLLY